MTWPQYVRKSEDKKFEILSLNLALSRCYACFLLLQIHLKQFWTRIYSAREACEEIEMIHEALAHQAAAQAQQAEEAEKDGQSAVSLQSPGEANNDGED